jgi:hypothetical protein
MVELEPIFLRIDYILPADWLWIIETKRESAAVCRQDFFIKLC